MKNKYVWMYSSFVVLGFSFLMLFYNPMLSILHSKYPVKVSTKEQIELRKWIFNFNIKSHIFINSFQYNVPEIFRMAYTANMTSVDCFRKLIELKVGNRLKS